MRSGSLRLSACLLAAGTLSLFALQSALTQLGWTQEQINQIAQSYFSNSSAEVTMFTGWLTKPVHASLLARGGPARAQIVRELALSAKRFVQAPGFAKTHDAWIGESLNAVNHGLKVEAAAPESMPSQSSMHGQLAASLAEGLKSVPAEGFQMMIKMELDSLRPDRNAAEKTRFESTKRIQSLIPSRYEEAKKLYVNYMVAKMGGPADSASVEAAIQDAKRSEADQKRREQQLNYNKYNLKAQLRERLGAFVTLAKSVDFAAQTKMLANRRVFVNPAYESRNSNWKLLYRLGREPVMAALEVAEQWRREL